MDWLDELKPGDLVGLEGNFYNPPSQLTVTRVTKTMIVTTKDLRWNKNHGGQVGGGHDIWHHRRLVPWTLELKEERELYHLKHWFQRLGDDVMREKISLSVKTLREMKVIATRELKSKEDESVDPD